MFLLGGLLWGIVDGPLITARSVEIDGAVTVPAEEILGQAQVEDGEPLIRMDTGAIERRVESILSIASADVSRSVYGTVTISVVERTAVATVPAPDGLHLIDGSGVDFKTAPLVPPGLPELRMPDVGPGNPATVAALEVLAAIPEPLRPQLIAITAATPGDIRLLLTDDRAVSWGSADRSAAKGAILGPLLTRPGDVYDVSSPDLPTIE